MAGKRIDRNNYDPERVLEIVREQTDHDEQSLIGTDELLRLLGESAHAYLLLRRDALELYARLKERVKELERISRSAEADAAWESAIYNQKRAEAAAAKLALVVEAAEQMVMAAGLAEPATRRYAAENLMAALAAAKGE